ncbi:hypothetical protein L3Q82_007519 [Scortum barcoo]|uniref:Uncharacterized protein n=1 Tax=Scortum barcoo TaxID=214431 RepID=A0ACB8WPB0_9TELE|nr:hypothetical protein L3Q82_007519 [Scortum barcoo]
MTMDFYTTTITSSITVWYTAAASNGRLQRIVGSTKRVFSCSLPSLQDLQASWTLKRAGKTPPGRPASFCILHAQCVYVGILLYLDYTVAFEDMPGKCEEILNYIV